MRIESVFGQGKPIPQKYTCQGENVSPPLEFYEIPQHTQSLVLIMDDPDAPSGTFDHWVEWNISANTHHLVEGVSLSYQGKNSYGLLGYKGPCPPSGKPHRYFFKLYALDVSLSLAKGASKTQVENALEGHVLAKAELMGTYQRIHS